MTLYIPLRTYAVAGLDRQAQIRFSRHCRAHVSLVNHDRNVTESLTNYRDNEECSSHQADQIRSSNET